MLMLLGRTTATAQDSNYAVFEQGGLYYSITIGNDYCQLVRGDVAKYYIEHNGDMSGFNYYAEPTFLPAYCGNVTIPDEVTYQGKSCRVTSADGFSGNDKLTGITLGKNLTSIPSLIGTKIKSLHIPANITWFDEYMLNGALDLETITVSSSSQTLASVDGLLVNKEGTQLLWIPQARSGRLVIPEGIKYTYSPLISYCTKLTTVVLPSSFEFYGIGYLLANATHVKVELAANSLYKVIDGNLLSNAAGDSVLYILPSNSETLTIPEGVKCVNFGNLASFYYEEKWIDENNYITDFSKPIVQGSRPYLKTLNLPSTIQEDYEGSFTYAFSQAYYLETINVASGSKTLASVDGVLTDNTKTKLKFAPMNHAAATSIPAGISVIGNYALRNNRQLKSVTLPSTVKTIENNVFEGCRTIEKIALPTSLGSMGESVFTGCANLKSVTGTLPAMDFLPAQTFQNCSSLTSIPKIPEQMVQIGAYAFQGCSSLAEIHLPSTLQTIDRDAFYGCSSMKSISLPVALTTVGAGVFENCQLLEGLTLPASVNSIGNYLTFGCPLIQKISVDKDNKTYCDIDGVIFTADKTKLVQCPVNRMGDYTIPTGTQTIGSSAFSYTNGLKSITIPEGVSKVEHAAFSSISSLKVIDFPISVSQFDNQPVWLCDSLEQLIFRTSEQLYASPIIGDLGTNQPINIYVHEKNFNDFASFKTWNNNTRNTIFCLTKPFAASLSQSYVRGLRFKVVENELTNMEKQLTAVTVNLPSSQNSQTVDAEKLADGTWFVKGLSPNERSSYGVTLSYKVKGETETITYPGFQTKEVRFRSGNTSATQTTVTLSGAYISDAEDTTAVAKKYEIEVGGQIIDLTSLPYHRMQEPITFTGLYPGAYIPVNYTVTYDDGEQATYQRSISTQTFNARGIDYALTPTTLRVNIAYTEIDATPDSVAMIVYRSNNYSLRDTLYAPIKRPVFTGLTPGMQYNVSNFFLVCKGQNAGNFYFNNLYSFTTPQLELNTEQPQIPEQGRAIVAATTNTGDDEGHIGFEWRKYDAPADMKSQEAYGIVYSGKAQGQIKNLSTSNYYRVRAFYDDAKGIRYYAKNGPNYDGWITFDPSEVSEMEPVVHTDANVTATNTTALLVGIMIQGSDDITEQGFEYWEVTADEQGVTRIGRKLRAQAELDVHTIVVTGQRMTAEISDLIPGTVYAYRAYVKTVKGTVYGEECNFKTNGERPTGIDFITDNAVPFTVKATSSRGTLRLAVTAQSEEAQVTVHTVNGQLAASQRIAADGSVTELQGMPRGMVLISVKADGQQKTIKTILK